MMTIEERSLTIRITRSLERIAESLEQLIKLYDNNTNSTINKNPSEN